MAYRHLCRQFKPAREISLAVDSLRIRNSSIRWLLNLLAESPEGLGLGTLERKSGVVTLTEKTRAPGGEESIVYQDIITIIAGLRYWLKKNAPWLRIWRKGPIGGRNRGRIEEKVQIRIGLVDTSTPRTVKNRRP